MHVWYTETRSWCGPKWDACYETKAWKEKCCLEIGMLLLLRSFADSAKKKLYMCDLAIYWHPVSIFKQRSISNFLNFTKKCEINKTRVRLRNAITWKIAKFFVAMHTSVKLSSLAYFFFRNTQQREVREWKKLVSAHNSSLINSGASAKPSLWLCSAVDYRRKMLISSCSFYKTCTKPLFAGFFIFLFFIFAVCNAQK